MEISFAISIHVTNKAAILRTSQESIQSLTSREDPLMDEFPRRLNLESLFGKYLKSILSSF